MTQSDLDRRLLETAARWRLRIEDVDPGSALAVQFEAWLDADHTHRLAYERVGQAVAAVDVWAGSGDAERWRLGAWRDAAGPRRWLGAGVACATVVAAAACVVLFLAPAAPPPGKVYSTNTGETLQISAADGTQISLDGASRVEVRYSRGLRRIDLIRGQARFRVVHNASRPFEVVAGDRAVIDSGTDFDVDRMNGQLTVTLLSGRVLVGQSNQLGKAPALQDAVSMQPGERLNGSVSGGPWVRTKVSANEAVAWQQGQIALNNQSLGAAAGYFGRYSDRPIRFADSGAAGLRISGVFNANDPDAFAQAVALLHHLSVSAAPDGAIVLGESRKSEKNR